MKTFLTKIISLSLAAFLIFIGTPAVQASGAATMILTPQSQSVEVGDTFEVTIDINANTESIDTVRAYVAFSADVLQATDVSLGSLFPRVSPGSSVNNTSGEISMGGFTLDDPVDGSGVFATMTFEAIAEGVADISVLSSSKMISAGEEKINPSGIGSASVDVGAAALEEIEEGAAYLRVESRTHPNENAWSQEKIASFAWTLDGGETDIAQYYVAFDDQPETDPTEELSAEEVTYEIEDVEDGLQYFHIKGVHESGLSTNTVHYAVRVDATSPNPIEPTVSATQVLEGETIEMYYGTTDETSGVLYYEVAISGGPYVPQESPILFEDLEAGTYILQVGAVDHAGNSTYGSISVRVYPEDYDLERPVGYDEDQDDEAFVMWNTTTKIVSAILLLILIGGLAIITTRKRT